MSLPSSGSRCMLTWRMSWPGVRRWSAWLALSCISGVPLPSRVWSQTAAAPRGAADAPHWPRDSSAVARTQTDTARVAHSPAPRTSGMAERGTPLGIPMTRIGSGTSWLPDDAPMHALYATSGLWDFMVHGSEDGMYDRQIGGGRGADQPLGLGWLMGSAGRPLGDGRIDLRDA